MTVNNLRSNANRYRRKYVTEATKRIGTIINRQESSLRWLKRDENISYTIGQIFQEVDNVSSKLYNNATNPNSGTIEYSSDIIRDCLRELARARSNSIDLIQVKRDIMNNAENGIKEKYRSFKIDLIAETNRLFEERKSNIEFQSFMSNDMIKNNISVWVPNESLQTGTIFSMPVELSFEYYIDENITDDDDDSNQRYIKQKLPEQLKFKAKAHIGVLLNMRGQYVGFRLFDNKLNIFKSFHSSGQGNVCLGDLEIQTDNIQNIVINGEWSKLVDMFQQIRVMFKTVHMENGFHETFLDSSYCGTELINIENFINNGCEIDE